MPSDPRLNLNAWVNAFREKREDDLPANFFLNGKKIACDVALFFGEDLHPEDSLIIEQMLDICNSRLAERDSRYLQ